MHSPGLSPSRITGGYSTGGSSGAKRGSIPGSILGTFVPTWSSWGILTAWLLTLSPDSVLPWVPCRSTVLRSRLQIHLQTTRVMILGGDPLPVLPHSTFYPMGPQLDTPIRVPRLPPSLSFPGNHTPSRKWGIGWC